MYKLIIVDDEKKIAEGIREIFPWNNVGFEVEACFTSAIEALHYLETHTVDAVMTDVSMPDMSGLELTRKLREIPDMEIVIFSSYTDYTYMREALQMNVEDYLQKPLKYDELFGCFEKLRKKIEQRRDVTHNVSQGYYDTIVSRVDQYLEQNYQKASLGEAAELLSMSASHLSKIYKEQKKIGFQDSLITVRMRKACEMLKDPTYKSYEIAFLVGYDNPKNFARAFKNAMGVSPREYRIGNDEQ